MMAKTSKTSKKGTKRTAARAAKPRKPASKSRSGKDAKPKLLSGGNPQIAKGYGDAPVQAYIAAMPGWKSDVGRRLDALIARTVPGVSKAVKWNSPFYGVEGEGWFLSFHCFTKYIKVAFFAVRRCVLFLRASPSTRRCAISISTRASSMKRSSATG